MTPRSDAALFQGALDAAGVRAGEVVSRANTLPLVSIAARWAKETRNFPYLVPITRLDSSVGPIDPTPTQRILLEYFSLFRWTYTDKYRQAMSSSVHVADQLRHVAFTPGAQGLLAGDQEKTYKELMRRMGIMYNGLPDQTRPPLERPPSSEVLTFAHPHNGFIQGLTGGGENPAVGFSPDYSVLSEYGLIEDCSNFDGSFFPSANRRPNGICRIETTPGQYNSAQHNMFRESLAGRGRFHAIFLLWTRDKACVCSDPPFPRNFQRTSEEDAYAARVDAFDAIAIANKEPWYAYKEPCPVSDEHLWFRRIALETEFHGDPRLFDAKYPPSPHEGWLIGSSPTIPADPIVAMRKTAVACPEETEVFLEEREPGAPYLLTVDGTGYGNSGGDPAGMILWNMWDWRAVGCWHGREDPGVLSKRVLRWQAAFDCDVIAETNKDGVPAALDAQDCPKLFWSNGQPGWFSSRQSKQAALIALVDILRAMDCDPSFIPVLDQLAVWDGRTRADTTKKLGHHFDLAICCLIFAFATEVLGHPRRARPPKPKEIIPAGRVLATDFLALYAKPNRGRVLGSIG